MWLCCTERVKILFKALLLLFLLYDIMYKLVTMVMYVTCKYYYSFNFIFWYFRGSFKHLVLPCWGSLMVTCTWHVIRQRESVLVYLNSVWSLAEPAYLFNTSFQFPSDWKSYKIHPINSFKRRFTWHNISNYHPISLLPVLSKAIESIVYKNVIYTFCAPPT